MKTRSLLLALLIIGAPAVMNAQLGNMLKKGASKVIGSVGKAASKEAGNEIDSMAVNQANKTVENNQAGAGEQTGQRQSGGGMGLGARLFSNEVTAKYDQEYRFGSKMYMQMEMYDKDEVVKMDYNVYYNPKTPNAGMEMKSVASADGESVPFSTMIIVDGNYKTMLMVTDVNSMKIGLVSPMPDDSTLKSMETTSPSAKPKVTKTGNTKVVAGFRCDEYLYQEEGVKEYSKMWLTKDAVLNVDKNVWSKAGMPAAYGYSGFEGMVVMAYELYDDKGKLAAKSEVKEINNNFPHTMSVAGTTFRQVDFGKMAANQNQGRK